MAFKIIVTIKQQGKEDIVEEHSVSREAFVAPAMQKLKTQHQPGKTYSYETVTVQ